MRPHDSEHATASPIVFTLRPTRWWPRRIGDGGETVRVIEPCSDDLAELWSIYREDLWIADFRVTERALAEFTCECLNRAAATNEGVVTIRPKP